MALFINETTTSLADFISKLNTFLTTGGAGNPGWTADVHTPASGRWAVSKDNGSGESVEVAFQWDTATPNRLGVYQYTTGLGAGNYNSGGGTVPYDQDGDSGQGAASTSDATIATLRHAEIGNTPVQYWCFTGDTYAHIVVEISTGVYTHFGFGVLEKFNDWTGGEYCYGQKYNGGAGSNVSTQAGDSFILDELLNVATSGASLHLEGMKDSPTGGKWALYVGPLTTFGNDRQGTPKARIHVHGGMRGGIHSMNFGQFRGSAQTGLIPGYPLVTIYRDHNISGSSSTSGAISILGQMKDVRGVHLFHFAPAQEVTIGADTWVLFPTRKKYPGSGAATNTTAYQGVMYKQST